MFVERRGKNLTVEGTKYRFKYVHHCSSAAQLLRSGKASLEEVLKQYKPKKVS